MRVSHCPWSQGEIRVSWVNSYLSLDQGPLVASHTLDFHSGDRDLYRTVVTWPKGGCDMSKDEEMIVPQLGVSEDSDSRSLSSS